MKIIIVIAMAVLLLWPLYKGCAMLTSGQYVNVKGQKLNCYSCSSGGDMNGSSNAIS